MCGSRGKPARVNLSLWRGSRIVRAGVKSGPGKSARTLLVKRTLTAGAIAAAILLGVGACANGGAAGRPAPESLQSLIRISDAGDPAAATAIGQSYEMGIGVKTDPARAETWYRRAGAMGDPLGQYLLAQLLENGRAGAQDIGAAASWYLAAARQGHAPSQAALGRLYDHGAGGLPQDPVKAAQWYALAASAWDASGRYPLGSVYATGRPTALSGAGAIEWYRRAARRGIAEAQFDLAQAYESGAGVGRDLGAARDWYRNAAAQGDGRAAAALVRLDGLELEPVAFAAEPSDAAERAVAGNTDARMPPAPAPANELAAPPPEGNNARPIISDMASVSSEASAAADRAPVAAAVGPRVHLGSFRARANAALGWGKLLKDNRDLLGAYDMILEAVDLPAKGPFVRLYVIADGQAAANGLCADLAQRGLYCHAETVVSQ